MVVLHHTAMLSCDDAVARLCDPSFEVSAHYVISETGQLIQLVEEDQRAWHAGAGVWGSTDDVNSHSIGVELANPGPLANEPPFPAAQMAALETLLCGIADRHDIPPENVIAHSDMAPVRKFDPGAKFDWQRLARQGLAVWPQRVDQMPLPDQAGFLRLARKFGYPSAKDIAAQEIAETAAFDILLAAFRLRFFPGKSGPLDPQDMAAISDLATRFASKVGLDPGAGDA